MLSKELSFLSKLKPDQLEIVDQIYAKGKLDATKDLPLINWPRVKFQLRLLFGQRPISEVFKSIIKFPFLLLSSLLSGLISLLSSSLLLVAIPFQLCWMLVQLVWWAFDQPFVTDQTCNWWWYQLEYRYVNYRSGFEPAKPGEIYVGLTEFYDYDLMTGSALGIFCYLYRKLPSRFTYQLQQWFPEGD